MYCTLGNPLYERYFSTCLYAKYVLGMAEQKFGIWMETMVYSEKHLYGKGLKICYKNTGYNCHLKIVRGETPQKANHTNQDPFGF
jgi:hypothetical protein